MPYFPACCDFLRSLDIFGHAHDNFILLMISFVFIAYILTELVMYSYHLIARLGWLPKIGKILVSQGYITQDELYQALKEQSLKIGEILLQNGRITQKQLNVALKYQKHKNKKIGEILKELGYLNDKDIHWALSKMDRRLGKILRDKNLLSDYDFACAMSLRKCRIDSNGRILARE
jgi:hypothetical protein